ncbi:hypothetical protein [Mucilaginibacter ginkgonis]|uniref:Uncharacterized protein n=1 Tax=Mucilaginibacter ginkgonis TaxID=2682091 RepID=A0A6I4IMS1_9SPHI|nr:hypothetical protein [Mucilaginibacter ginkgonis]QQL50184.1 hypothetical protein GO620_001650 [Mucilaginibacter ginkgonis]
MDYNDYKKQPVDRIIKQVEFVRQQLGYAKKRIAENALMIEKSKQFVSGKL